MNIPTREELKARYNISNDDFSILTESPPENEIWKEGWIELVESISGVKTALWHSWRGGIIAVIVLIVFPPTSVIDYVRPIAVYTATELLAYFSTKPAATNQKGFVAFLPQNIQISGSTGVLPFDQLPVGTGLFPASGEYRPA